MSAFSLLVFADLLLIMFVYIQNISMKILFMNKEKSNMNEPKKFVLKILQRLDWQVWENRLLFKTYQFIRRDKTKQQYKNNELKITAATRNDEFKLPNDSYSR